MTQRMITAYINMQKKSRRPFDVTVSGVSMNPILKEGDIVTVQAADSYSVGDILMFAYTSDNDFRVHRLLAIADDKYHCKGDNAFLIETISYDLIIGKVTKVNRNNIDINVEFPKDTLKQIVDMSYGINREFELLKRDTEATKETALYKEYYNLFLREKK